VEGAAGSPPVALAKACIETLPDLRRPIRMTAPPRPQPTTPPGPILPETTEDEEIPSILDPELFEAPEDDTPIPALP